MNAVPPVPAVQASLPGGNWRERWLEFRNRLLAKPAFQRWAAGNFLTRGIARKRARALFDLVAGFVYSQVLAAGVQLNLFSLLAEGPRSAGDLAPRLGLDLSAAERLLKAAAALELAEHMPDGRYALGHLGAALLGNPALPAMIAHHAMLYADLADPVALLRGDAASHRLADFWAYAGRHAPDAVPADDAAPYSRLMSTSQSLVAGEILGAYPFEQHKCLLDIGGGDGTFLMAAGERHQNLKLVLFDLPGVVAMAAARLTSPGISKRIRLEQGSFLNDALPMGADIATLVRVLHDHDDGPAQAILTAARRALGQGGVLLVAEPMSGTSGAEPMGEAYFGFYLAAMGSGRPRTPNEIMTMLAKAGFSSNRLLSTRTPLVVQVIAARV
jgi:demethylspheroidene O-methyltransferase